MSLPVNTTLLTKDGRRLGNALIVETYRGQHVIKTDYGNRLDLSMAEITRYFYIGEVASRTHKYFVKDIS